VASRCLVVIVNTQKVGSLYGIFQKNHLTIPALDRLSPRWPLGPVRAGAGWRLSGLGTLFINAVTMIILPLIFPTVILAGVHRFDSAAELAAYVDSPAFEAPIDGITLLQAYIKPYDGRVCTRTNTWRAISARR
jgi:hypothetical protein